MPVPVIEINLLSVISIKALGPFFLKNLFENVFSL